MYFVKTKEIINGTIKSYIWHSIILLRRFDHRVLHNYSLVSIFNQLMAVAIVRWKVAQEKMPCIVVTVLMADKWGKISVQHLILSVRTYEY